MSLITEDYRALNRSLHEDRRDYGVQGHIWADAVVDLLGLYDLTSVLDYGCGKGSLRLTLKGFDVREYDPAIPGKDETPQPAHLVTCFDVLEHVEPDCLESVLSDLKRCTQRILAVNICVVPALKCLADGRNAHLIVETPDWWRLRLSKHFHIEQWLPSENGCHVFGVLRPLKELGDIQTKCAVNHEERMANVKANVTRCKDRVFRSEGKAALADNGRKAVLVCFGPSLGQTWPTAALERAEPDTDLFTVSAAHRFMVERGVPPKAHMDCDPREHKARQIGAPHADVEYWLASCVHPSYLDLLGGHAVKLWHAYNGERSMEILEWEPDQRMVVGGGSIGVRALSLLYYLGYRTFSIHGMDCSFKDGAHYAGEHLGRPKDVIPVRVGERQFETNAAFVVYARYFLNQRRWMCGASIRLHGDGLLQTMARQPETFPSA